VVEPLRVLFEKLVSELPTDCAILHVRRIYKDDGTLFELVPVNKECAPISVHVEDEVELVDFSFGQSGTWELPCEGRSKNGDSHTILLEIEQLIRAVVGGHCEIRRRLLSVFSEVYVEDYTYCIVDVLRFSFPPFTTTRYKPYV
jgi:hypothetical protein